MIRDAHRIEHMLGFVRRGLEILDGVDLETYLSFPRTSRASRGEHDSSW